MPRFRNLQRISTFPLITGGHNSETNNGIVRIESAVLRTTAVTMTLLFNGYGDQVAGLYSGMDLKKYF